MPASMGPLPAGISRKASQPMVLDSTAFPWLPEARKRTVPSSKTSRPRRKRSAGLFSENPPQARPEQRQAASPACRTICGWRARRRRRNWSGRKPDCPKASKSACLPPRRKRRPCPASWRRRAKGAPPLPALWPPASRPNPLPCCQRGWVHQLV